MFMVRLKVRLTKPLIFDKWIFGLTRPIKLYSFVNGKDEAFTRIKGGQN